MPGAATISGGFTISADVAGMSKGDMRVFQSEKRVSICCPGYRSLIRATFLSRARLENVPSADIFGHNPQSQFRHENLGRDFNSRAARNFRGGLHRPGPDRRSAERTNRLMLVGAFLGWGTWTMLSVDQFLRMISVPAVVVAFLIASQISGGVIPRTSPIAMASK